MRRFSALASVLVLSACSSPLEQIERLDSVALDRADPATAQVAASAEEVTRAPGLPGLFRRNRTATAAAPVAVPDAVDTAIAATVDAPTDQVAEAPEVVAEAPAPRRGLLSRLRSAARSSAQPEDAPVGEAAPVQTAALAPQPTPEPAARNADRPRRGLFGGGAARIDPNAPDAQLVSFGTAVPYGQIARVCDAPKRNLGREIARYPERGPVYRLYDSKPDQTGLRTHYITGFKDGCPRQFTAALALFGDPQIHEQLRYGLPSKVQPYSQTDDAYESVKNRVCRVGRSKPCGARMDKLAKDTVFVSTYERFQGSPLWANILLHDGRVVEKDKVSN